MSILAWTVVLEKSPVECREVKPINLKGNQCLIFIGRTDAEAEAPILWPPGANTNSLVKTLILGKTEDRRRRKEKKKVSGMFTSMEKCNRVFNWLLHTQSFFLQCHLGYIAVAGLITLQFWRHQRNIPCKMGMIKD